jgi:hypothetical protein
MRVVERVRGSMRLMPVGRGFGVSITISGVSRRCENIQQKTFCAQNIQTSRMCVVAFLCPVDGTVVIEVSVEHCKLGWGIAFSVRGFVGEARFTL